MGWVLLTVAFSYLELRFFTFSTSHQSDRFLDPWHCKIVHLSHPIRKLIYYQQWTLQRLLPVCKGVQENDQIIVAELEQLDSYHWMWDVFTILFVERLPLPSLNPAFPDYTAYGLFEPLNFSFRVHLIELDPSVDCLSMLKGSRSYRTSLFHEVDASRSVDSRNMSEHFSSHEKRSVGYAVAQVLDKLGSKIVDRITKIVRKKIDEVLWGFREYRW